MTFAPTLEPVPEALEAARRHHAQGSLLRAAEGYRQALAADPGSQPALLGLSLVARQSNQGLPALRMAEAALAAGAAAGVHSALAWANYGDALAAVGQSSQAEAVFRYALRLDDSLTAAHFGLGNLLALREDFPAALACFQTAVRLAPWIPESHFAEAFAHGKLGDHGRAIAAYRRAVELRPGFASAWLNMGVELIADGRDQLADLCYRQAMAGPARQPWEVTTRISAHLNLGHLERSRRDFARAREQYECALALAPGGHLRHAEVLVAFAYLHLEEHNFAEAWRSLDAAEEALRSRPQAQPNAEVANARGILLLAEAGAWDARAVERAIAAFQQAEAQGHRTAASNRGNALLRLGRCEEALAAQQAAVALDPYHPGVRYNLALTQLRLGNFAEGWANYEIRWSFREVHPHPRRFAQPRWRGEALEPGARLLFYGEQGLGDTLQFCRYLLLVAERLPGVPLLLEAQPPVARLLESVAVPVPIVACGEKLPPFTHHCPLMSLPAVFGTTVQTVPAFQGGYLHADPELVVHRGRELEALCPDGRIRVGIAWAGNPKYRADRERSTRLATFLPLLRIRGIAWIALQKGDAAAQIAELPAGLRSRLYDGCSQDADFAVTAALVAHLDLVITTDTAVAHLAGALGKPVWILLPWQADWRWMQERLDTPWYPTARLFRQRSAGDWAELAGRVAAELCALLRISLKRRSSIPDAGPDAGPGAGPDAGAGRSEIAAYPAPRHAPL